MRTTIDIDDELLAQLKQRAAKSGRTMASLVEDAVREMLARTSAGGRRRQRIVLPTHDGRGVLPGVDLWDSASLEDVMGEPGR